MSHRDQRVGINGPLLDRDIYGENLSNRFRAAPDFHDRENGESMFEDEQGDDSLPLINEQDISAIIRQAGATKDNYRDGQTHNKLNARGRGGARETKLTAGNSMMNTLQKSLSKSIVIAPDAAELAHDRVLPPGRAVDFQAHMDDLKARTETEIPYTATQVEDAMYLDKTLVVTLEYHYYQKG